MWLDEYKEELLRNKDFKFIQEALKNNYDGSSRTVGTLDPFKTKSRVHRTGYVISGEMRADDAALDSRCINVTLNSKINNDLYKAVKLKCARLQCLVVDIMKNYDDYWQVVRDRTQTVTRILINDHAQVRMPENYATICAALDCFCHDPQRIDRIAGWLTGAITQNMETNVMSEMVSAIPYLKKTKGVKIPYLVNREKQVLNINAVTLMSEFRDRRRDLPRFKPDELIRLGKDADLMSIAHNGKNKTVHAEVNEMDGSGEMFRKTLRCFVFDLRNEVVAETAKKLAQLP